MIVYKLLNDDSNNDFTVECINYAINVMKKIKLNTKTRINVGGRQKKKVVKRVVIAPFISKRMM